VLPLKWSRILILIMNSYLFILGKHRALSIAELFMHYPAGQFQALGQDWVLMDLPGALGQKDLDALGGSMKIGKVIPADKDENRTETLATALSGRYIGTKLDYGVSVYGMPEQQLKTILIGMKKVLRAAEIKSRFINNNFQNITAAQYKSIRGKGVELLVAKEGGRQWVAETVAMQDIDAYSQRDYGKPFRDMKMGMLPPKLAQILINLTGVSGTLWDPFCGSGVVVMEGLLMGHPMIGSDIHAERVEGAKKNVEWLRKEFGAKAEAALLVHDATKPFSHAFDGIACESDLGMPHSQQIRPDMLQKIMAELDQLYVRFFESLKNTGHKSPVVIALPFFRSANGSQIGMDKTVQSIERLGFKRTPMLPDIVKGEDRFSLKYSRPDQAVGRAIYRFTS
jgi:tRNA G10  N-methylase Trm11